jgi:hypothetical protein
MITLRFHVDYWYNVKLVNLLSIGWCKMFLSHLKDPLCMLTSILNVSSCMILHVLFGPSYGSSLTCLNPSPNILLHEIKHFLYRFSRAEK